MDLLPAICVDPDGIDTWLNLIEKMIGYNVTVALTNGKIREGQISRTELPDDGNVYLFLTDVNGEWESQETETELDLLEITGIVVH